jgi:hypothetical protein
MDKEENLSAEVGDGQKTRTAGVFLTHRGQQDRHGRTGTAFQGFPFVQSYVYGCLYEFEHSYLTDGATCMVIVCD